MTGVLGTADSRLGVFELGSVMSSTTSISCSPLIGFDPTQGFIGMKELGDFDPSAIIYGKFTTYQPSTGAAFALAGSPALSVYKDNSVTQSTSGITLTAPFDSTAGLNHFTIDTSSDGTFYSAGSFFDIVITTGTVDSVSVVGAVVGGFTLRKNSSLKPTTAGRSATVDTNGRILVQSNTVTDVGLSNFMFVMVDSAGIPRTGLSVTPTRSIDGAAFAGCTNAVSEISNGWYKISLSASDLNGTVIALRFTATGAQDNDKTVIMVP